jgi:hypothetical protein
VTVKLANVSEPDTITGTVFAFANSRSLAAPVEEVTDTGDIVVIVPYDSDPMASAGYLTGSSTVSLTYLSGPSGLASS